VGRGYETASTTESTLPRWFAFPGRHIAGRIDRASSRRSRRRPGGSKS
jgi:hypothetical protein